MALTAPTLNSVTPGDGQATVNFTPVGEVDYDHVQVLYKKRGEGAWTVGVTAAGTPDTLSSLTQTGLTNGLLYDFELYSASGDASIVSPPSDTDSGYITDGSEASEPKQYIDNLKNLLANCAALHTWMGLSGTFAAKVAAATARIYDQIVAEGSVTQPFVLIERPQGLSHRAISGGSANVWLSSCTLHARFVNAPASAAAALRAAIRTFMDNVDAVIGQAKAIAGTDNFLYVTAIDEVEIPQPWESDAADEEIQAVYSFACGLAG